METKTTRKRHKRPEGFERLPLFDCRYSLYVPSERRFLPNPSAWKACDVVGSGEYACREMVVDWETDDGNATGGAPLVSVEPDGTGVAQFRRIYTRLADQTSASLGIVAEVDGAVRQAIWDDYDGG